MCGKPFFYSIFMCLIVTIWGLPDVDEDLEEQSLLFGTAFESNNITKCEQDLKLFIEGVIKREIWALHMLDSSGQEEAGYLFVNSMWMGSKSQCRNINTDKKMLISPYEVEFKSVLFKHNNTMQIQYGIMVNDYLQIGLCLPKSCSSRDIAPLIEKTIVKRQLLFLQNYPVEISLLKVKSLSEENYDWLQHPIVQLTIIILLVILLLTIAGSCYDIWINAPYLEECLNENKKEFDKLSPKKKLQKETFLLSRILLCYSLPANVRSLFDTSIKNDDLLAVVHGLKAIVMFYIVISHFGLYLIFEIQYINIWYTQILFKSIHSVDTCFCLSGFLLSYAFCKYRKDKKPFTLLESITVYVMMILHRVIRILPSYIITIGIVVTLWRYTDQTYPLFRILDSAEEVCPTYWWRNLLFINSWYPRSEMCLTWSWYISHDVQFYVVNCALLILSTKYPKMVLFFCKFLVVYSIVQTGWLAYKTSYIHTPDDMMLNEVMYYSFSVRMVSYFVGVLAGYYFNKWNGKIPLSDKGFRTAWIICLVLFLYVVHGLQYPTRSSKAYIIFYVSLSKFLWSSCIAWLTMSCSSGQGGIINKFLSHKCWIPLSRVTFAVYFTNLIVIDMFAYTGEHPTHNARPAMFCLMFGTISACFLVGTVFSLMFEVPFVKLTKMLSNSNGNKINHPDKIKSK